MGYIGKRVGDGNVWYRGYIEREAEGFGREDMEAVGVAGDDVEDRAQLRDMIHYYGDS